MSQKKKVSNTVAEAMAVLKQAFINNPDYAHSWHCNLAMAFYDTERSNAGEKNLSHVSNEAASRFMKLAFDIETSNDMLNDE